MNAINPNLPDLSNVNAPITSANGLPNWLYADKDALAAEKQAVFAPGWAAIGFGKDVPNKGDMKPVEFLGQPLLIVRGRDGVLRVFQNTCRHRGVMLVEEETNSSGLIRCPYHAWCYSLKGQLKQTPHVGGPDVHEHESIDKSALGLFEIRSHVWFDTVFVNLSGTAPPFEQANREVLERWAEYNKPIFHGGTDSSFSLEVATNWKLAVENYCEAYHLPFIHPGLNSYSRLEDHYNIVGEGGFSGQGTTVYNPKLDDSGRAFTDFAGMSSKWDTGAEYIALYPNVLFGVQRDHIFSIILEPVAIDRTIEHVEIYYADPAMCGAAMADLRQRNFEQWKNIFIEDIGVVESMQKGRNGDAFDGGRFSPVLDEGTHRFHQWIADAFTR